MSSKNAVKESILQEADRLVNGDRQAQYGHPYDNFTAIAELASTITGKHLTATDCAYILVAVKLARQRFKYKRDNLTDAAGYLKVVQMIIDRQNELSTKQKKVVNKRTRK